MSQDTLTLVSFNINGIRARFHQLSALTETYNPQVIGLQEIKVDDPQFPIEFVESLGYQVFHFGQKAHYGVALMIKQPFRVLDVIKGLPQDALESQKRVISVKLELPNKETWWVINGYFPQGESRDHPIKFPAKALFYQELTEWVSECHLTADQIVVMGDMNISPEDKDIGIGDHNAKRWLATGKCSFLPEEREWYQKLIATGLVDSYRHLVSDNGLLSWFDYRSRGFEDEPKRGLRIDHILASKKLVDRCVASDMAYDIRAMEKPSDHCPVYSRFTWD
jgi:exodeoxyribonuclease-3